MRLDDLAETLRAAGLPVVEVPGWRARGHGDMIDVRTITVHHTAGPPTGDYPSLATVRDGRPDLAGPLAQLGLGRSGTWQVIAAGLCHHAGPSRLRSQGNAFAVGIEVESTGRAPWPDVQRESLVRGCAALVDRYNLDPANVLGHKETCDPPGRKVDPNIDMAALRADVARALSDPREDSDMTADDLLAAEVTIPGDPTRRATLAAVLATTLRNTERLMGRLDRVEDETRALRAQVEAMRTRP